MRTIWKFPVRLERQQTVTVPGGWRAKPLHAGMQNGALHVWVMVDTERPVGPLSVWVLGTGDEITADIEGRKHLGTVQDGAYIWHVFSEDRP